MWKFSANVKHECYRSLYFDTGIAILKIKTNFHTCALFSTCSKGGPYYKYGQWNLQWQIMIYNDTGNDNKNKVMYKKWYTVWLTKRMVVFEFVVVLPVDTVFACYCSMVCSSIILSPPSVTIKFYNTYIYNIQINL